MRPLLRPLALAGLLALLLAACNGDAPNGDAPDAEADGDAVTFVAVDLDFEEAPGQIAAGDVEVELVNDGSQPHNVVFEGVDDDAPVVEAGPGETATGTVQLEPGEYTAYCGVPGHRDAGMEVTVTVD